jgi:hypothetical protein
MALPANVDLLTFEVIVGPKHVKNLTKRAFRNNSHTTNAFSANVSFCVFKL